MRFLNTKDSRQSLKSFRKSSAEIWCEAPARSQTDLKHPLHS